MSDPLTSSPVYTVAGGPNLSHTIWTVSCQCPDDVSAGVAYANMQALLMSVYGYNLLGASYGAGLLSLQVDDEGLLNPADPTSPGAMIGAVADALAAAGEISATGLTASSANTAGFSFPIPLRAGGSITGVPSGTASTLGGFDIGSSISNLLKTITSAISAALKGLGGAAIWTVAIVAGLAILFVALTRK